MKKILLSGLLITATLCSAIAPERKVYVCDSPGAVAYHYDRNCRGLGHCKHTVSYVTLKQAKADGLRLCKICGK